MLLKKTTLQTVRAIWERGRSARLKFGKVCVLFLVVCHLCVKHSNWFLFVTEHNFRKNKQPNKIRADCSKTGFKHQKPTNCNDTNALLTEQLWMIWHRRFRPWRHTCTHRPQLICATLVQWEDARLPPRTTHLLCLVCCSLPLQRTKTSALEWHERACDNALFKRKRRERYLCIPDDICSISSHCCVRMCRKLHSCCRDTQVSRTHRLSTVPSTCTSVWHRHKVHVRNNPAGRLPFCTRASKVKFAETFRFLAILLSTCSTKFLTVSPL